MARTLTILVAVGCFLGAAAYAAKRSVSAGAVQGPTRPLEPRLIEHPDQVTTMASARFDAVQPGRPPARARPGRSLRFECRLDRGEWAFCRPPVSFADLDLGSHRFELRAVNASGRFGPAAGFTWRVRGSAPEPTPAPPASEQTPSAPTPVPTPPIPQNKDSFTIEQVAPVEDLFPGEPAQPLSLRLTNNDSSPITVTALTFSFAADPPGCATAENFIIVPSDASVAKPIQIAAKSSVELPAQGVAPPQIAMRELPVNQNACQGAVLQLKLEGESQG